MNVQHAQQVTHNDHTANKSTPDTPRAREDVLCLVALTVKPTFDKHAMNVNGNIRGFMFVADVVSNLRECIFIKIMFKNHSVCSFFSLLVSLSLS